MATLAYPPRVIGVFRREDLPVDSPLPDVGLALWHVGDPGNVGTLVRSADALGPAFVATLRRHRRPDGPQGAAGDRWARSSACRIVGFETAPGRRVALVAHGGRPLDGARPLRADDVRSRRGTRRPAEEVLAALRGAGDDPLARRRGFPERRRRPARSLSTSSRAGAAETGSSWRRAQLRGASRPRPCLPGPVGAPVEPAVARLDLEAGLLEEAAPLVGREPGERHRRFALLVSDGQRQRPRRLVPDGTLEDPGLALEPAVVRLRRCRPRPGRRRRTRSGRPAGGARTQQRGRLSRSSSVCMCKQRAERTDHERDSLRDRWLAKVAHAQVDRDAGERGAPCADIEHPARRVHTDDADPVGGDRHRDATGSHSELDHRPPGSPCFLQVERHVLDDAGAPGVVELRYRVITAQKLDSPCGLGGVLRDTALKSFAEATTLGELADGAHGWLGRKSELKVGLRNVRDRETGMALNAVRERLGGGIRRTVRRSSSGRRSTAARRALDVTAAGRRLSAVDGCTRLTQIRREVEDIFLGLGYEIVDSREVETVWHNFDALNQPADSPIAVAPRHVLRRRRHASAHAHLHGPDPRRWRNASRRSTSPRSAVCYRRDTPSPRSTPNFHQVEALAVDRGITLADLKGTLMHFFRAMFGEDRDVRMRTSFFPFTEPSVEFDVTCFLCGGKGCAFCKYTGWFEMGGAGVVDPRCVRERGATTPRSGRGFAWGIGPRPHRGSSVTASRHPHVLGERPASPEAVLSESSRSAGCGSTSRSRCRSLSCADRLVISTSEVDGYRDCRGVAERRRQPRALPRRTGRSTRSSIRMQTGCSCARSTSARASRARSSAARGTSERAQPSASRYPARCCRTACSSSSARFAASSATE